MPKDVGTSTDGNSFSGESIPSDKVNAVADVVFDELRPNDLHAARFMEKMQIDGSIEEAERFAGGDYTGVERVSVVSVSGLV